jgi:anti-sigma factor RsiW
MSKRKDIKDFELAAMADGSLSADRRREIEDQLHETSDAHESIDAQRSAVELIRGIDVDAPQSLDDSVARMIEKPKPQKRRFAVPALATASAFAVAIALVIVLPSGPSVDSAAKLAAAGPQSPAPTTTDRRWLDVSVGSIQFPNWKDNRGLVTYGKRTDQLDGRTAKTVFYRDAQRRSVAYTIVDGKPLTKQDSDYEVTVGDGVSRVVWTRDGHTCILVSRDLPTSTLETLRD